MSPKREQPLAVRVTHWVNAVLLATMAASGLQILVAYPFLGAQGERARWYPLQGWRPPDWMRAGGWLAGARHLHFGVAWLLAINAAIYLAFLATRNEWRRRLFSPRRDARDVLATAADYARLKNHVAPQGPYNGLQRLAYTTVPLIAGVQVLTGLALYKPVQLSWLAALFGGYDGARALHLIGLAALAVFTLGHVSMVLLHPRTLVTLVTGGAKQ